MLSEILSGHDQELSLL